MRAITFIFVILTLTGCASPHNTFYQSLHEVSTLKEVELLMENQEPTLYTSDNMDRDIIRLRSKHYIVIGYSSFNGGYEDQGSIIAQAKSVGATVVLASSEFTNTATTTSMRVLPDNQTTYHSGNVSANTTYNNTSSGSFGYGSTNGTYSGTSTTYGTKTIPVTSSQNRYDQNAVYFVKLTNKFKFGVTLQDLTAEQRSKNGRNVGAMVEIVYENTPAFTANLLMGDILIAIDGKAVAGWEQAYNILDRISDDSSSSVFTILRNGSEKDIVIKL